MNSDLVRPPRADDHQEQTISLPVSRQEAQGLQLSPGGFPMRASVAIDWYTLACLDGDLHDLRSHHAVTQHQVVTAQVVRVLLPT